MATEDSVHSLPPSTTFPAAGNTTSTQDSQHSLPPSTTFPAGNTSRHSRLPPSIAFPEGNIATQESPTSSTAFPGSIATQESPPSSTTLERDKASGLDEIKKNMFKDAMNGKWNEVVKAYKDHPKTQDQNITRSGDTALHVAVFDGKVEIVRQLVGHINELDTLRKKNEGGNTALHLAAALGMVEMCECMANKDAGLIGVRNEDNESPLFLAALHGHKEAFLGLHSKCPNGVGSSYCRRNDGETVLHVAITGEYFDLAYQIIHQYPELVTYVNQRGHSPLHILAGKPSVFKSGSRLGLFGLIVYHCIFVDLLEVSPNNVSYNQNNFEKEKDCVGPNNYRTCLNFFLLFYYLIEYIFQLLTDVFSDLGLLKSKRSTSGQSPDTENPQEKKPTPEGQIIKKSTYVHEGSSAGVQTDAKGPSAQDKQSNKKDQKTAKHQFLPPNYIMFFDFFKLVMKALLIILGLGFTRIHKIIEKKANHTWACQIMEKLVEVASDWEYEGGRNPRMSQSTGESEGIYPSKPESSPDTKYGRKENTTEASQQSKEKEDKKVEGKRETPILVAAKMGVTEMIEVILDKFPVAIQDMNSDRKNVVLLAVENRQPHVYKFLLKRNILRESVFRKFDKDGNSALHLAATLGQYRPWLIPGAALQMQWEIKWYKFVKNSMPPHFFARYNNRGVTPKEVFTNTHRDLVKGGGEWLTSTSQSCSVVAALIATVAFATAATVPGGVKENGAPRFENEPAFDTFAISSLIALCFSVTALIMFLSILTSRYQEEDFGKDLPNKLIMGLTSLFISIASMLVSFCAGHFYVLKDKLKYATYPVYAVTCLPVTFFAVAQFPLYIDLIRSTFKKVPQRSYKVVPHPLPDLEGPKM